MLVTIIMERWEEGKLVSTNIDTFNESMNIQIPKGITKQDTLNALSKNIRIDT